MAETFLDRVSSKALGELLIEHGCISQTQCDDALALAKADGIRLGEALIRLGHISPDMLSLALGEQFGVRPVELNASMVDLDLLRRFPAELLYEHSMLPLIELGEELVVLVSDPHDHEGLRKLGALAPASRITAQLCEETQIRRCLAIHPSAREVTSADLSAAMTRESAAIPAPEASEESFVRWLVTEALQHPEADVVLRSDGQRVQITRMSAGTAEKLHELHGALFDPVREAIWKQCDEISYTAGRAAVWASALRFAGHIYSLQVTMSRDLAGTQLRLRPLVYGSSERSSSPNERSSGQEHHYPRNSAVTLVLYESLGQMQDYLEDVIAQAGEAGHRYVLLQEVTRRIYPTAASFPGTSTDPGAAALGTGATSLLFDYLPSPATLERLIWQGMPATLVVCAPSAKDAGAHTMLPEAAQELLRSHGARVIVLDADGAKELEPAAALESLGGAK